MHDILRRLTNTKTLIGVVSLVVFILMTWGIEIPVQKVEYTVQALCTIGVMLGIMNDKGMETVKWNE